MGGDRETMLDQAQQARGPAVAGSETTIAQPAGRNPIRLHQSGGHIHFHDDIRKLKVAVPAAKWWKAWDNLQGCLPGDPRHFSYVDVKEKAILLVTSSCEHAKADDPYTMVVDIEIQPCVPDKNFTELANFTVGAPK